MSDIDLTTRAGRDMYLAEIDAQQECGLLNVDTALLARIEYARKCFEAGV